MIAGLKKVCMKASKLKFLEAAKRSGLFEVARRHSTKGVRILNYHGIWTSPYAFAGDSMFFNNSTFQRRLELIRAWGYPVVPLNHAIDGLSGKKSLPPNALVITIDDGWYSTCQHMLPALQSHGMPVTIYCDTAHLCTSGLIPHVAAMYFLKLADLQSDQSYRRSALELPLASVATDRSRSYAERLDATEKLAKLLNIDFDRTINDRTFHYMTPTELIEAAKNSDLSIELHTHNHTMRDWSSSAIEQEIALNRSTLAEILKRPTASFQHFCYPSGEYTSDAAEIVKTLKIKSATTTKQGIAVPGASLFTLPRICDNEMLTELEFEAELSGFADWMRVSRFVLPQSITRSTSTTTSLAAACLA